MEEKLTAEEAAIEISDLAKPENEEQLGWYRDKIADIIRRTQEPRKIASVDFGKKDKPTIVITDASSPQGYVNAKAAAEDIARKVADDIPHKWPTDTEVAKAADADYDWFENDVIQGWLIPVIAAIIASHTGPCPACQKIMEIDKGVVERPENHIIDLESQIIGQALGVGKCQDIIRKHGTGGENEK